MSHVGLRLVVNNAGGFPTKRSMFWAIRVREGQHRRWHGGPTTQREAVAPVRHLQCQWIDGEVRAGFEPCMCRAPVVRGKSWCAAHDAVVFIPPFMSPED